MPLPSDVIIVAVTTGEGLGMAEVSTDSRSGRWTWWFGGALLIGVGIAVHRLLDFDIDTELDWDNLPA